MIALDDGYYRGNHCKFLVQYHIIWCPKFRYKVLGNDEVVTATKNHIQDICDKYDYVIKALEVMPDHIHIFLAAPQTVAPCDVAKTLKSILTIRLFRDFPYLKKFYARCGILWSRGYFISTIGNISAETVKKYIEQQTGHHGKEETQKEAEKRT